MILLMSIIENKNKNKLNKNINENIIKNQNNIHIPYDILLENEINHNNIIKNNKNNIINDIIYIEK